MIFVRYGCKVKPETKILLKNLVTALKKSGPYPGHEKPISSQAELLEDMLRVYEIAHPSVFQVARSLVETSPEADRLKL